MVAWVTFLSEHHPIRKTGPRGVHVGLTAEGGGLDHSTTNTTILIHTCNCLDLEPSVMSACWRPADMLAALYLTLWQTGCPHAGSIKWNHSSLCSVSHAGAPCPPGGLTAARETIPWIYEHAPGRGVWHGALQYPAVDQLFGGSTFQASVL